MIKFLIDEDMPRSTEGVLKAAGHDAVDARDCGLRGRSDEEVFEFAQQAGAIILSADLGFGDLHKYPLGMHHGIFIVHFPNEVSTQELNKQLVEALRILAETDYRGNLIILEPARIKMRRYKTDR